MDGAAEANVVKLTTELILQLFLDMTLGML